ncbi:hypothetical protein LINPERHAP1_LOCUS24126, partial [Linum perenne]
FYFFIILFIVVIFHIQFPTSFFKSIVFITVKGRNPKSLEVFHAISPSTGAFHSCQPIVPVEFEAAYTESELW